MESIESTNNSLLQNSTTKDTITHVYDEYEYEDNNQFLDFNSTLIIFRIVFGLFTVTGLAGNILTVAVILRHKGIKSNTDILVLTLAITDILFIVFNFPLVIIVPSVEEVWHGGLDYVTFACSFANVYVLVLISLDRYLALVHPIRTMPFRTKRHCYILIIIIWSIVLPVNIPYLYSYFSAWNESSIRILYICIFVFEFMLPLLLMCILYGHILKSFHNAKIPGVNNTTSRVRLISNRRVTKMLIIAMMVFIICRVPFHIRELLAVYGILKNQFVFTTLYMVTDCMLNLNCCINPIVFGFHSKAFRKGVRDVLSCKT